MIPGSSTVAIRRMRSPQRGQTKTSDLGGFDAAGVRDRERARSGFAEDAVQCQGMEVEVCIQAAAESAGQTKTKRTTKAPQRRQFISSITRRLLGVTFKSLIPSISWIVLESSAGDA